MAEKNIKIEGQIQILENLYESGILYREQLESMVQLNSLKHPKYRLKTPVYISIEFKNDQVIASLDDIEAFAYAETTSEAIDCLCVEIVQVYEDLQENVDNLGPLPQKWFQFLEEVIECR